jgi:uncharacterized protein YqeY
MIVDEIKKQMTSAMKSRDEVARNVLGVARGEIQTAEARANRPLTEDEAVAVVRKLLKSNEETLAAAPGASGAATLRAENAILEALLPARMGVDGIVAALVAQREAIRSAKSDGQATGVAMKHLKGAGVTGVDGGDVAEAVKRIRA